MAKCFIALPFVISLVAATIARAQQTSLLDYTQWRGAQRDGTASGFIQPETWPDTLTRHWKVDVGEGYATPLVVGDTVYIYTRRVDDEVVTALNARTGAEVVKAGQLLFLLNDDAELIVARASRLAFEPNKRYVVADSATWAQPAISGNRVFIKDVSALTLWTVPSAIRLDKPPALAGILLRNSNWRRNEPAGPVRHRNIVESWNSPIEVLIATTSTWYVRPASTEAVSSIGTIDE